jgi:hypothetical protein
MLPPDQTRIFFFATSPTRRNRRFEIPGWVDSKEAARDTTTRVRQLQPTTTRNARSTPTSWKIAHRRYLECHDQAIDSRTICCGLTTAQLPIMYGSPMSRLPAQQRYSRRCRREMQRRPKSLVLCRAARQIESTGPTLPPIQGDPARKTFRGLRGHRLFTIWNWTCLQVLRFLSGDSRKYRWPLRCDSCGHVGERAACGWRPDPSESAQWECAVAPATGAHSVLVADCATRCAGAASRAAVSARA